MALLDHLEALAVHLTLDLLPGVDVEAAEGLVQTRIRLDDASVLSSIGGLSVEHIQSHKPKLTARVNSGAGGEDLAIVIPLHTHGGIAGWPNLGLKVGPLALIDCDIVQG